MSRAIRMPEDERRARYERANGGRSLTGAQRRRLKRKAERKAERKAVRRRARRRIRTPWGKRRG